MILTFQRPEQTEWARLTSPLSRLSKTVNSDTSISPLSESVSPGQEDRAGTRSVRQLSRMLWFALLPQAWEIALRLNRHVWKPIEEYIWPQFLHLPHRILTSQP